MLATTSNNIIPQAVEFTKSTDSRNTNYGVIIALSLIGVWAISLTILLSLDLAKVPVWIFPLVIFWQMFLYTGLFITAHDAMHGSICPQSPKINHLIGSVAVISYGLFSYKELLHKHWLHHRNPATQHDPDFHDGEHANFALWYFCFMRRYWSWQRFIILTIAYPLNHFTIHIPEINLLSFWVIPSLLSSIQLFYFGTFLTHREPADGFKNSHRAQTNALPVFWSFITCYHFGYHEEHHEYPHVPWWQLPAVHKAFNS